jgi:hypothetical protein
VLAWCRQHSRASRFAMMMAFTLLLGSGSRWLVITYGTDTSSAQSFIGLLVAVFFAGILVSYFSSKMGIPRR